MLPTTGQDLMWTDRFVTLFLDTEIERRGINTGTGGVPKNFKTKQINTALIDLQAHELFSSLL